jgi:hypothetical protein
MSGQLHGRRPRDRQAGVEGRGRERVDGEHEPEGVDRLVLAQPEPPTHARLAARCAAGESGVIRMETQLDPPHERRRERVGRFDRDAVVRRRQIGWRRLDPFGPTRLRHVAERAEYLHQTLPAGVQGADRGGEGVAAIHHVRGHARRPRLARSQIMAGDGHRIGAPGGIAQCAHDDAQEVAAVGAPGDVPAGPDLRGVATVAFGAHCRIAGEPHDDGTYSAHHETDHSRFVLTSAAAGASRTL